MIFTKKKRYKIYSNKSVEEIVKILSKIIQKEHPSFSKQPLEFVGYIKGSKFRIQATHYKNSFKSNFFGEVRRINDKTVIEFEPEVNKYANIIYYIWFILFMFLIIKFLYLLLYGYRLNMKILFMSVMILGFYFLAKIGEFIDIDEVHSRIKRKIK